MLGWAIRKGLQGATGAGDASVDADDTQYEGPDTPAPVFAARAIKNAIFGSTAEPPALPAAKTEEPDSKAESTTTIPRSPTKPTGILLTPGTGTARRKRVSFGNDVKAAQNAALNALGPSEDGEQHERKKTNLQKALENSRTKKTKPVGAEAEAHIEMEPVTAVTNGIDDDSEGEWEDDVCSHDVTVDLNEPHSNSGKYWKSTFEKYHEEARTEMESLVKYKHLAKSYARQKDAEAVDLNERLREEQMKVQQMEKKITEMAAHVADKSRRGTTTESNRLLKDLAKQTALALQYRDQVQELETLVQGYDEEVGSSKTGQRRVNTSPRTQQTLLEVSRELRRARSELKEMGKLRDEVARLKLDLQRAEERTDKLKEEKTKLAVGERESSRVQDLENQLRDAQRQSQQKDSEIEKLTALKQEAKKRTAESLQVLSMKNEEIAKLKAEIETLKSTTLSSDRSTGLNERAVGRRAATHDLISDIEALGKPSKNANHRVVSLARRPNHSVSAEDLTRDLAKPLTISQESRNLDTEHEEVLANPWGSDDWSADMRQFEQELKKEQLGTAGRAQQPKASLVSFNASAAMSANKKGLASESRRVTSDVLTDRVNEASPRTSRTRQPSLTNDALKATRDNVYRRATTGRHGHHESLEDKNAAVRSTLDQISSGTSARLNSIYESPAVDLLQDRYARLGGMDPNASTLTANASRCTLPADRQAAARARLQQKRMERRKAESDGLDKENVRP